MGKVKCDVYFEIVEVAGYKVAADEDVYVNFFRCPLAVSDLNG